MCTNLWILFIDDVTDTLVERSSKPKYCDDEAGPYEFDSEYRSQVC